jgi:hypothetical protein
LPVTYYPNCNDGEIEIRVRDRTFRLTPAWADWRWNSENELPEADFPLILHLEGKRYQFYSDGTFAEVEK